MPSAEEVADNLGLSKERRKFLSDLASTAKSQGSSRHVPGSGMVERSSSGRKRSQKKAA
jgi:hypothetical protein